MNFPRTSPAIVGLTIVFLGAMAFAIPEPPIEAGASARGGYLVGNAQLSDVFAEQKAGEGYAFLAVDLTGASIGRQPPLWVKYVNRTTGRRFPIWGFIDTRGGGVEAANALVQGLNLKGLFVYGPDARAFASALRARKAGLEIVPVLREGDAVPAGEACAMVYSPETFPGDGACFPVLAAGDLRYDRIAAARAKAKGDHLVAAVTLR